MCDLVPRARERVEEVLECTLGVPGEERADRNGGALENVPAVENPGGVWIGEVQSSDFECRLGPRAHPASNPGPNVGVGKILAELDVDLVSDVVEHQVSVIVHDTGMPGDPLDQDLVPVAGVLVVGDLHRHVDRTRIVGRVLPDRDGVGSDKTQGAGAPTERSLTPQREQLRMRDAFSS